MTSSIISLLKRVPVFGIIGLLLSGLFSMSVYAAETKEGSYTIDYTVKKAEDDSVSMANDYFEKPASVEIKNGQITVEVTMNHSEWITEFKTPVGSGYADAQVIQTDAEHDKRTVRFRVSSLEEPQLAKIHVTVSSIDYDHDYTIRFVFDGSKMSQVAGIEVSTSEPEKPAAVTKPSAPTSDKGEKESKGDSGSSTKKDFKSNSSNKVLKKHVKEDTPSAIKGDTLKKDTEDTRSSVSTPAEKEVVEDKNESSEEHQETSVKSTSGTTKEKKIDDSSVETKEVLSIQQSDVSEPPNGLSSISQDHAAMNAAEEEQDQPLTSQPTVETRWYMAAGIVLAAVAIGSTGWLVRKRRRL